jgi:hypothetical protein
VVSGANTAHCAQASHREISGANTHMPLERQGTWQFFVYLKRAKSHKVLETLGKAPVAINTVIGVQVALKRLLAKQFNSLMWLRFSRTIYHSQG